jgi:hypothetical protein
MKKYNATFNLLILLFISFTGQAQNNPISYTKNLNEIGENDNFWVTIDKIERTTDYPSKIIGPTNLSMQFPAKVSKHTRDDWDFAVIYFTVSRIEKIHIVGLGSLNDEQAILFDVNGNKYKFNEWSVKGVKLSDPNDIRSSMELIEGAKGYLVFKIPKIEKVDNLLFVYYFKESLDDKSSIKGQINIDIDRGNE